MANPCMNCADRSRACHDTCEPYKTWKAAQRAIRAALKREREWDAVVNEIHHNAVKRAERGQ